MKVSVIGCGLIGSRRAKFLGQHELVCAVDVDLDRAKAVAAQAAAARVSQNWRDAAEDKESDLVIVATTPDIMPEITLAALNSYKHVLVEKPAARNYKELIPVVAAAKTAGRQVHVGFNHRYHPSMQKARAIVDAGEVGELMYIRGRYGHGGRLGYEQEWRADPEIAGGGELIDQGMHLIDLSRWFLGEFTEVTGFAGTYFWDMPVDDNAFAMLRTKQNQVAWLHASWTEWKNLFSFEIFGRTGKLQIDGLGGSYGVETLTHYKMKPEMGPPEIEKFEYPGADQSWQIEFEQLIDNIEAGRKDSPNAEDALAALKIADKVYGAKPKVLGIFK
ncbi:MAG TPA: Gfo/Idh/MocA family oxidoreductase [Trichormus sp.]|jgi:predicted dehydrogenase